MEVVIWFPRIRAKADEISLLNNEGPEIMKVRSSGLAEESDG